MKQNAEMTMKAVLAMAMQVGISTALSTTLFILGGVWVDRHYGTTPIFILVGAVLGLVCALYIVWQIVQPLQKMK